MAKMKIAQAQKIVKDSRYGEDKKKEARKILREAKKAGKLRPKRKSKTAVKPKTTKRKSKTIVRTKKRRVVKTKKKPSKTKAKPKARKTKTKTKTKKLVRRKTKKTSKKSKVSSTGKVKFYDVKTKKYVRIPREDCKIKRNRTPRGGDRLIGSYKGRELHTFVKKGFKL